MMRVPSIVRSILAKIYIASERCARELRTAMPCAHLGEHTIVTERGSIENASHNPSLISVGNNSWIDGRLLSYPTGGIIHIGSWCYIGQRTDIWSMKSIVLGDRVFISHNVNIHDTNSHSLNAQERHEHFRHLQFKGGPSDWCDLPGVRAEPIIIENDVWIGFGCNIFKGVRIGRGSVVAAGSTVTKDIPPYSFYRCRFDPVITPLEHD